MSLTELDAFLAHARSHSDLLARLQDETSPLEISDFLQLAHAQGFPIWGFLKKTTSQAA